MIYYRQFYKRSVSLCAAIPSLRARDCSKNEKEALNYLFLLIPLLNVIIPFFWKSFAVVWSADIIAFFGMYAWKVCFIYARRLNYASFILSVAYSTNKTYDFVYSWDGYRQETRQSTVVGFLQKGELGS